MDLTYQPHRLSDAAPARSGTLFLHIFGVVLLGYALLGRTVAYVGVPPLFIGEVVLVIGIIAALRTPALRHVMSSGPFLLLVLLMSLALVRTVPYVGPYGLDAARDAMQLGYGLFAFVIAALLLERPERLRDLVRRYQRFVVIMLALVWAAYLVSKLFEESIPFLPWTDSARLVEVKAGDLMVHLAAITVFLMAGLMRLRPLAVLALAFTVGIVIVSSRAGMMAYGLAVGTAWLLRPATAKPGRIAAGFVLVLALGLAAGPVVAVNGGEREVSVEQLWRNVTSVFVKSGTDTLDGSTEWRKAWWGRIVDYTVTGPYFWTGRGFGINLAKVDGFSVSEDESLRSPHNGHLTILARMGVPGLALWILLQLVWLASVLRAWFRARLAQQHTWTGLFALVIAYWLAMTVNASFDVYLEGPMGGIWFWTVWGVGLAAVRLHRTHPALFDDLNVETESTPPVRRSRWTWASPTVERSAASSASPAWSWPREPSTSSA